MAENLEIPVANLLIDEHNPRLSTVDAGQRTSLHDLAKHETTKLLSLAESIAKRGLSPAELPIVRPDATQRGRYIVLEGNRRLCALQILENPLILGDSVSPSMMKRFNAASKEYLRSPIAKVLCSVIPEEDTSRYWIRLRHTGENNGAGVASWGPLEQARFEGSPEPYRELLERFVRKNLVSEADVRKMSVTNFQRVVNTAGVREHLGYAFNGGRWSIIPHGRLLRKRS